MRTHYVPIVAWLVCIVISIILLVSEDGYFYGVITSCISILLGVMLTQLVYRDTSKIIKKYKDLPPPSNQLTDAEVHNLVFSMLEPFAPKPIDLVSNRSAYPKIVGRGETSRCPSAILANVNGTNQLPSLKNHSPFYMYSKLANGDNLSSKKFTDAEILGIGRDQSLCTENLGWKEEDKYGTTNGPVDVYRRFGQYNGIANMASNYFEPSWLEKQKAKCDVYSNDYNIIKKEMNALCTQEDQRNKLKNQYPHKYKQRVENRMRSGNRSDISSPAEVWALYDDMERQLVKSKNPDSGIKMCMADKSIAANHTKWCYGNELGPNIDITLDPRYNQDCLDKAEQKRKLISGLCHDASPEKIEHLKKQYNKCRAAGMDLSDPINVDVFCDLNAGKPHDVFANELLPQHNSSCSVLAKSNLERLIDKCANIKTQRSKIAKVNAAMAEWNNQHFLNSMSNALMIELIDSNLYARDGPVYDATEHRRSILPNITTIIDLVNQTKIIPKLSDVKRDLDKILDRYKTMTRSNFDQEVKTASAGDKEIISRLLDINVEMLRASIMSAVISPEFRSKEKEYSDRKLYTANIAYHSSKMNYKMLSSINREILFRLLNIPYENAMIGYIFNEGSRNGSTPRYNELIELPGNGNFVPRIMAYYILCAYLIRTYPSSPKLLDDEYPLNTSEYKIISNLYASIFYEPSKDSLQTTDIRNHILHPNTPISTSYAHLLDANIFMRVLFLQDKIRNLYFDIICVRQNKHDYGSSLASNLSSMVYRSISGLYTLTYSSPKSTNPIHKCRISAMALSLLSYKEFDDRDWSYLENVWSSINVASDELQSKLNRLSKLCNYAYNAAVSRYQNDPVFVVFFRHFIFGKEFDVSNIMSAILTAYKERISGAEMQTDYLLCTSIMTLVEIYRYTSDMSAYYDAVRSKYMTRYDPKVIEDPLYDMYYGIPSYVKEYGSKKGVCGVVLKELVRAYIAVIESSWIYTETRNIVKPEFNKFVLSIKLIKDHLVSNLDVDDDLPRVLKEMSKISGMKSAVSIIDGIHVYWKEINILLQDDQVTMPYMNLLGYCIHHVVNDLFSSSTIVSVPGSGSIKSLLMFKTMPSRSSSAYQDAGMWGLTYKMISEILGIAFNADRSHTDIDEILEPYRLRFD